MPVRKQTMPHLPLQVRLQRHAAAREATGSAQSAIIAAEEAKKAADANEKELGNKVTAEKGKGLSECNYTKEEKNKLAGIQTMQGTDGEENGKEGLVPAP